MINKTNELSFSDFYITELFSLCNKKARERLKARHSDLLKTLNSYLLKQENPIAGLERLAQYQGTNDLAIFLFDIIDRIEDYAPNLLYTTLPDVVEDYLNLFTLMVEDGESYAAMQKVITDFREAEGVSAGAEEKELVEEVLEEKLYSFDEFYQREVFNLINAFLEELDSEDRKLNYMIMINVLRDADPKKKYPQDIAELVRQTQKLFPAHSEKLIALELMKGLERNTRTLIEQIGELDVTNSELFSEILISKQLPGVKEPVVTREEVSDKAQTIDGLLREYFNTEVEDHTQFLDQLLEQARQAEDQSPILKKVSREFRSLKEISMIHGYAGIEFFCEQIIREIKQARNRSLQISDRTVAVFRAIFDEMRDSEKYISARHDQHSVEQIGTYIEQLKMSWTGAREEVAPAEEVLPEEYTFSDKDTLYSGLKEVLAGLKEKIISQHVHLPDEKAWSVLFHFLDKSRNAAEVIDAGMVDQFFQPLEGLYLEVRNNRLVLSPDLLDRIEEIWNEFTRKIAPAADYRTLEESLVGLRSEAGLIGLQQDADIAAVLSQTTRLQWQKAASVLPNCLLHDNPEAKATCASLFEKISRSLKLVRYNGYLPFYSGLIDIINEKETYRWDEAIVEEIDRSLKLSFDRIASQGREGNCHDLLEVVHDILSDYKIVAEEAVEPENEDEVMFRNECRQNIDQAKEALGALRENKEDRTPFSNIENSFHSIRTAANLLKKKEIADKALNIEEAAEMFSAPQVELPEALLPTLEASINSLEASVWQPEQADEAPIDGLREILDQLMLEEEELPEEEAEAVPQEDQHVEEKPLFAGQQQPDQELLDIFRTESGSFIETLEKANEQLLTDPSSKEALRDLEYAAHSMMSAAKMLGFSEIGQICGSLEKIVDALKDDELQYHKDLHSRVAQSIDLIKRMSSGAFVSRQEIDKTLEALDAANIPRAARAEELTTAEMEDINEVFLVEADELIEKINEDLIELEKIPESGTLLTDLLRNIHTLKGSAMMSRQEIIGDLCHRLEDYFELYREQNATTKQEMLNPTFAAVDLIQEILGGIKEGLKDASQTLTSRLAEIDNKLFLFQNLEAASSRTAQLPRVETIPASTPKKARDENIIRVNTEYLDDLVDKATELVVDRTELVAYYEDLKKIGEQIELEKRKIHETGNLLEDLIADKQLDQAEHEADTGGQAPAGRPELTRLSGLFKEITHKFDSAATQLGRLSREFDNSINQISNLSKVLHHDLLRMRMVPAENLFNRFSRPARDLAKSQKKQVNLKQENHGAELDRAMVETLYDPVMHIIRNAIDHGIELPAERKEKGKTKAGNIILSASQEKSQIIIEISDDGRGIDLDKIKEEIISKNLASAQQVKAMNQAEILDYIFLPEFSTSDQTTNVSGRGMGLDVVATQIQKLKGVIRIRTEKDKGTTFSIRLPLTLVVSQALMTETDGELLAIPLLAVQESMEIESKDILRDDRRKYVQVRGKLLPFIHLNEILHFGESGPKFPDQFTVLILHDAGVSMALGIGRITGRQEIVIKALGSHLQNVEYIAGGTILGNGQVALILDYAAVIRAVEFQFFGNITDPHSIARTGKRKAVTKVYPEKKEPKTQKTIARKKITGRKPIIMIVDDSSSVRSFISSVLEKQGFATVKCSNGQDALKKIAAEQIDLVITDLEMPEMHGFELIEHIRGDESLSTLPIVILTARSGKTHQSKGEKLGANAFISKPFKEGDLITVVGDFIEMAEA